MPSILRYGLWGKAVLDGIRHENLLLDVLILALGIAIYTIASFKKEYHPVPKVCIVFIIYTGFLGLQLSILCVLTPLIVWAVLSGIALLGKTPAKPAAASGREERVQKRDEALQRVVWLGERIDDCLTEESKQACLWDAQALFRAPEDADTSDIELFLSIWGYYELHPEEGSRRGS